ncbi:MAG: hypothetical protein K0R05_3479 [Anaerocolumna sp.]|jgi:hypothetical protein|nr:hypothetical protein [Anaerocolumna sp.]
MKLDLTDIRILELLKENLIDMLFTSGISSVL